MAELVLKIGSPDPGNPLAYQDGDILCAFNRRRIRQVHAEHVCDVRKTAFNRDGLRVDSLARDFRERTARYRFERVSATELLRTDLATLATKTIGPTPDEDGHYCHVDQYLARRKASPNHAIFGTEGAEVFYEGMRRTDHAALDLVWQDIEAKSAFREADHTLWPLSEREKRHFLALPVDDFDDTERGVMETPAFSGQTVTKIRQRKVAWQALLPTPVGKTIQEIQNRGIAVDIRASIPPISRASIVEAR
jgi:hypothetical protein